MGLQAIFTRSYLHEQQTKKRAPKVEKEGWANLGACWSVLECIGAGN
jgi:hypothetical protein